MKVNILIRCLGSVLFVFFLTGCVNSDTKFDDVPDVFVSIVANNLNSQESVTLTKRADLTTNMDYETLYCKSGDVIELSYSIYFDNEGTSILTEISHKVYGFDWEKIFKTDKFVFSIIIPELLPGKYPITYETSLTIQQHLGGFLLGSTLSRNFSPQASIILIISE